jgi:predicted O-linked N-acetylglucosamine transferase (SPINDLY family)
MNSKKQPKQLVIDLNQPHTCEFCHRSFSKESTLASHVCEQKRRHQNRNASYVKKAFWAYNKFYQQLNPAKRDQPRSYQEFCASQIYNVLIKFGSWCEENMVQEWASLVTWLINQNIKIDQWCELERYQQFLEELLTTESSEQALQRSFDTISKWSENTGRDWTCFFSTCNTNQVTQWIQQGRISAWLLYNCEGAGKFFERCTPEQLSIIQNVAPIRKWKIKFLRLKQEADVIHLTLKESGL